MWAYGHLLFKQYRGWTFPNEKDKLIKYELRTAQQAELL